jgi:two-component system, OmpR family, phosphate regulon sensor histidine kinase PhoR
VEVIVSDSGMGIPADELPLLFQRFFRAERATAGAIPGTGLGLAIAKAIVTGHGGRIRVESEDGAGTTFRVILPG